MNLHFSSGYSSKVRSFFDCWSASWTFSFRSVSFTPALHFPGFDFQFWVYSAFYLVFAATFYVSSIRSYSVPILFTFLIFCVFYFSSFVPFCAGVRAVSPKELKVFRVKKWFWSDSASRGSLKPGVKMLHWGAEVVSSHLQPIPGGPPWQLEERSSPWRRPHRTPTPRSWLASSCSFSFQLFSRRPLLSQQPQRCLGSTRSANQSARRKSIRRFPSKVWHHL